MTVQSDQTIQATQHIRRGKPLNTPKSTARFWDRIAKRYAAKPVPDEQAYARKLAVTREYLNQESRVLELGCGTGSTAITHAPYVRHIRASDFSSAMIDIAKAKSNAAGISNIDFVCRTVDQESANKSCYDAVLALNLLHLLVDWQSTIKAAYGLLPDNGVLVISTPCLRDKAMWLRWLAPIGASLGLMPTLSFFSQDELESTLLDTGFEMDYVWQPSGKSGLFMVARKPCSELTLNEEMK